MKQLTNNGERVDKIIKPVSGMKEGHHYGF